VLLHAAVTAHAKANAAKWPSSFVTMSLRAIVRNPAELPRPHGQVIKKVTHT
jgi:hypothetical protein